MKLNAYRLRILFRSAFALLASATLALALSVLREEKQLSYRNYAETFNKNAARIAALLRHPSGQLALLNPELATPTGATPTRSMSQSGAALHPVLLPFSALDFDDQSKVQQAVEMSGCQIQYPNDSTLCVAIGANPWAGGYIYIVGAFNSPALVAHRVGDRDFSQAHRARVEVRLRGQDYRWIAPYELNAGTLSAGAVAGRLTGFSDDDDARPHRKPIKDFRGWLWHSGLCLPSTDQQTQASVLSHPDCARRALFSMRLPIDIFSAALVAGAKPQWPPADLGQIDVKVQLLPPGDGPALVDSAAPGAQAPFSLSELRSQLQPGERLQIHRLGNADSAAIIDFTGDAPPEPAARWISGIIRRLPIEDSSDAPIEFRDRIQTPLGHYELRLTGDIGSINRALGVVATRVSWLVGGLLLAIFMTWLAIEIGIIRRIARLTQRAEALSRSVKASVPNEPMVLPMILVEPRGDGPSSDWITAKRTGGDELDILARGLSDLLRRVQEDAQRERLRAEQEKDQWHAVGHEIMSPLQSLMALHGEPDDPSHRYIQRMQQAVRVLYGQASPSEAFQSTALPSESLDLDQFLHHVAINAHCVGIDAVSYQGPGIPILVRANDYALEDVVTHILRNAQRYKTPDSTIRIELTQQDHNIRIRIHNQGPAIPSALLDQIFEYGVSDTNDEPHRGQGLFVAKTYMAKMGGTISAVNVDDGVAFVLEFSGA